MKRLSDARTDDRMILKITLKRLEEDLKFIKSCLQSNGIECRNIKVDVWRTASAEVSIWNGYRHHENSEGSINLSIDNVIALLENPERKILFRKFSKVS